MLPAIAGLAKGVSTTWIKPKTEIEHGNRWLDRNVGIGNDRADATGLLSGKGIHTAAD